MNVIALLLFLPALYYLWFFVTYDNPGSALLAVVVIIAAIIPFFLARHSNPDKLWFKARLYGYGLTPASWEGWMLTGMMTILFIFVGYVVDAHAHSVSDTLIAALPFWLLIFTTFFAIAYRTGEKPRLQWGKKKL